MNLDAIGIVSRNISETINFYSILGITFKETGGPDHFEGLTESGVRIMIDSVDLMKRLNPDWQEPIGCGVILCFKQNSPTAVNDLFKKITLAGYKSVKEPWNAFWGQRYSSIKDPDGNQIDIFAPITNNS